MRPLWGGRIVGDPELRALGYQADLNLRIARDPLRRPICLPIGSRVHRLERDIPSRARS
jgi:hypothetical protein